jgi:ankyrin repeat protein
MWCSCGDENEMIEKEVIDWFLNNELCDKNKVTYAGYSAMHYACYNRDVYLVGKLLKLPDIILDFHDSNGETPLQQLFHRIHIREGRENRLDHELDKLQAVLEIITLMLETGVQVNTKNNRGLSILDNATEVKNGISNLLHGNRRYQEIMDLSNLIVDTLYSFEVKRRWKMFHFINESYLEENVDDE